MPIRIRPLLACAASCAVLLSGESVAAQGPQSGGTLRILGTADLDHFDPTSAALVTTNNFLRAVSRQLVSYDASADPQKQIEPKPDLATEIPQPTDGGLRYAFKLRPGAMWNAPTGARPIVSADFKRGMKRMCNPALGSAALTYYVDLIVGMRSFCDGFAKVQPTVDAMKAYIDANDISGIETPDDGTIVIRLTQKAGDFIYMLSLPTAAPAPLELLDMMPDGPEFRSKFIASGPYTVDEYAPDASLKLKRNPAWRADSDPLRKAYVDRIEITFGLQADAVIEQLQSGDGDMVYDVTIPSATLQTLKATADEKLSTIATGRTAFLFINTVSANNKGAMKNLKVRQALQYAIDKDAIVQQMGGILVAAPQNGIFGPGVLGYHDFAPYGAADPTKARALLNEAGFPDGLTLKMPFRNQNDEPAIAQTIQASLVKAGFRVELTPVAPADFYSKFMTNVRNTREGAWDIAPVGWSPDWVGGAARSVFQPQFTFNGTHQTYNYTDYNNTDADKAADEAINATVPATSAALWAKVDEIVMADSPVVPYAAPKVVLYHGEAVQNFLPYAIGAQGDWTNVWLSR